MNITNALRARGVGVGKRLVGDAQPGDVRAGKTFSNAEGNDKVGTLTIQATGAQTITPGTSDIVKGAGIYDGPITIKGDADLISSNIRGGKDIFGVVGSIPVQAAGGQTITPGTVDIVKAAGIYDGPITISGDADLIASNIRSGKNIFGVVGTLIEGKRSAEGTVASMTSSSTRTITGLAFTPTMIMFGFVSFGLMTGGIAGVVKDSTGAEKWHTGNVNAMLVRNKPTSNSFVLESVDATSSIYWLAIE